MKIGLPRLVGNGVKVAIVALPVTKRYVNVDSRHCSVFLYWLERIVALSQSLAAISSKQ